MYSQKTAEAFFSAYNEALADSFERLTANADPDQAESPEFFRYVRHETLNSMQGWYSRALDELEGLTPEAYIDSIDTDSDMLDFAGMAAIRCDEELPELLKIRMGQRAEALKPGLRQMAAGISYEDEESSDRLIQAANAIRLLGEWQDILFLYDFLERFTSVREPHGLIADAGQYFFTQLGQTGLDALQEVLIDHNRKGGAYTSAYEYLLVYVTELGRLYRGTDIYPLLRTAFRQMQRKVIAAICLGDYGDGRAVALLRTYIEEHEQDIDRQLYYESLSSIKRLGGDTRNLPDPFRDFSGGHPAGYF